MKRLYLIRHALAKGQPAISLLTALGKQQSVNLAEFFMGTEG
ncbi:hypothetical protein [Peribacillus sp. SCS-155]